MKTFILGVGAQKAGTTWLHAYLNSRSDADFGFIKEYHIHDAMSIPGCDPFTRYQQGPLAVRAIRELGLLAKPHTRRRLSFYRHPALYYCYFRDLLAQPGIQISGDITPSYSMLSASCLREIDSQVERHGMQLRTIYLMRDPVERIISAVRMRLRVSKQLKPEREIEALRTAVNERPWAIDRRSDYRHTLQALDEAFGLERVHLDFYETLFRPESILNLCKYLRIPYQQADFEKRFNVSATKTVIPDNLLQELGAWQRETWLFCREKLPDIDFDRLWPTASRWCQ